MKGTLTGALYAIAGIGAGLAARALRTQEPFSFKGRSVVITGGSRGLGLVIARELADEGARLTLLARDSAELERAAQDIATYGAEVQTLACDVRDRHDVERAIQRVVETCGRIDVLINNAGVIQTGPVEHMQVEDFEDAMAVHLWGPLYAMLAAVPHMRRQGGGRIVNISSIGGLIAVPHLLPYSTSKFALVGLSDGMRAELAKDSIRVTTVCPGLMRTGSHVNALFKGRHRGEFTWFAIMDSLPISSIDPRRAARQIVEACRRGAPRLVITVQAHALVLASTLLPGVTARALMLFNRLLPRPTTEQGNQLKTGWESQSRWAPSLLTRLSDHETRENNELRGHTPMA